MDDEGLFSQFDLKGNEIVKFSPNTLGFYEGAVVRNFKGSVISNDKLIFPYALSIMDYLIHFYKFI